MISQLEMFLDAIKIPLMVGLMIVESIALIYAIRVIRLHRKDLILKHRLSWRLGKDLSLFVVSGDNKIAADADNTAWALEMTGFLPLDELFIAKSLDERHNFFFAIL